jgi:hypothetical protein
MREKLIDVFMHLDRHIKIMDEYGICYTSDFAEAVETVLTMLKTQDANGVTVQKWIPVTERLPEKDVLVLCIGAKGGMFLGYPRWMSHDDTAYTRVPNARGGRYTKYWCYLPEPPKGE